MRVADDSSSPAVSAPDLVLEDRRPGLGRLVGFILLFLAVATGLATFSAYPWTASLPGAALLKVAFKHVAAPTEAGATLSREELEKLPRHMRPQGSQSGVSGTRRDTTIRVLLDGQPLLEKTYRPGGLRHDGPTFVYEELTLPPGHHVLEAALAERGETDDDHAAGGHRHRLRAEMDVKDGQVLLLELSSEGTLTLR